MCAAVQKDEQQVSKAIAAAALAAVIGFGQADAAKADISGLTPCSESKAYAKRLKNEVKALNKRLKNVSAYFSIMTESFIYWAFSMLVVYCWLYAGSIDFHAGGSSDWHPGRYGSAVELMPFSVCNMLDPIT